MPFTASAFPTNLGSLHKPRHRFLICGYSNCNRRDPCPQFVLAWRPHQNVHRSPTTDLNQNVGQLASLIGSTLMFVA